MPYKPYRANLRGCVHCGFSGYTGRKIIYELLINNEKVRHVIEKNGNTSEIAKAGVRAGFSMWDCGLRLVAQGVTSIDALKLVAKEETLDAS